MTTLRKFLHVITTWMGTHPRTAKFLTQVVLVVFFHLAEVIGRDTRFFTALRREGFEWVMGVVRPSERSSQKIDGAALPVVIVDISRLYRVGLDGRLGFEIDKRLDQTFAPRFDYTPRRPLLELVQRLDAMRPAAIGVDVDLSPDTSAHDGHVPKDHYLFLDECKKISGRKSGRAPTPVFLGVGRTSAEEAPIAWLGDDDFIAHAATILLCSDESGLKPQVYSLVPRRIHFSTRNLRSMSQALADSFPEDRLPSLKTQPPGFFRAIFSDSEELELATGRNSTLKVDAYYLNYAELDTLRSETIDAAEIYYASTLKLEELKQRVADRIVIIGDADFGRTVDKTIMPGTRALVPGVFSHACGVLTLLQSPLWAVPWGTSVGLILLVSLAAGLAVKLLERSGDGVVLKEFKELIANCALMLLGALLLVKTCNVVWLAVIAALAGAFFDFFFKVLRHDSKALKTPSP